MEFLYPYGGILLAPFAAAYFASAASRLSRERQRRPAWFIAPAVIAVTVLIVLLCTFQLDVFRPSHWFGGKVDMWILLLAAGIPSA